MALHTSRAARKTGAYFGHQLPGGPPEGGSEDEEGLDLPVNPDESNPIIPDDDDRVVHVPS